MAVVIRVGTRTAAVPILYYGYMINLLNNLCRDRIKIRLIRRIINTNYILKMDIHKINPLKEIHNNY